MTTSTPVVHNQSEPPIDPTINSEPGPMRIRKKLTGLAAEKHKEWTKAYMHSEKGQANRERVKARRRHHNALRKAARMADKQVEEARILGRPPSLIVELEAQSSAAHKRLSAYEEEHAAAKEARRIGDPEHKRLQYEKQKVLKREYSRRKRAEKKSQEAAGNGSGSGQVGGDEYEHHEMEEIEEVMTGKE
jgi:hypothetical protein